MTKTPSDSFLGPDEATKPSLYHPVLLTLIERGVADLTGIATIEFKHGKPVTGLPFRLMPTADPEQFMMTLIGRSRAEFLADLEDYAIWTPNYGEFFDLDVAHPLLLLDAFEQ